MEIVFAFYIMYFLIYLNMKFAYKEGKAAVRDKVLDRNVSSFVYIMNNRLVKEAMQDKLELSETKKQEIRLKAQVNEYMNEMLRRNGVSISNDEMISLFFMED